MTSPLPACRSSSTTEILWHLQTSGEGLTGIKTRQRLAGYGADLLKPPKQSDILALLLAQFKRPPTLILFFVTGISLFLLEPVDALIILAITLISVLLGFWQKRNSSNALKKPLSMAQSKGLILRDGNPKEIPVEAIMPGDIVILNAGDIVPGDCLIQKSSSLVVDEGMLTGETLPDEQAVAALPEETPSSQRSNVLWMGTHVVSGSATAVVTGIARETEFGKVSERMNLKLKVMAFERGRRRFDFSLTEVMLVLVGAFLAINVYLARPVPNSNLFSLALAVGLAPQLLPAFISINLVRDTKKRTQSKVTIKTPTPIYDFGKIHLICSDNNGTRTEGIVNFKPSLVRINHLKTREQALFPTDKHAFISKGEASVQELDRQHAAVGSLRLC